MSPMIHHDYELIQTSTITFNPNGTPSNTNTCQNYTLSGEDQFIAPSGLVIGLYSNSGMARPQLLRTDNEDDSVTTFQFNGNRSSADKVRPDRNNQDVDCNIAIRVHLSK